MPSRSAGHTALSARECGVVRSVMKSTGVEYEGLRTQRTQPTAAECSGVGVLSSAGPSDFRVRLPLLGVRDVGRYGGRYGEIFRF